MSTTAIAPAVTVDVAACLAGVHRARCILPAPRRIRADPKGQFEAGLSASPVYDLLGAEGIGVTEMPPVKLPVHGIIGFNRRAGAHSVTRYDWHRFLDVADIHLDGQ